LIDGPIIPISARTGKNLEELMRAAIETDAEGKKRIDDETLKEIVTSLPPPPGGNRILSLYQVGTRPPLFEVRSKDELPTTYLRFLRRKLREYFRFFGQPIVLKTRWGR
ncbi:ribosome biogenesis GTPase Der, partial [candidate division WOR-3 bacterium]